MIKTMLIEDSRLARKELKNLLLSFPEINIVGEATDGESAIESIRKLQPSLLFLDIQLPGKNGFEVLESLDICPQVIFTTAYDEYAIQSFEYNTLDYLLKPIHQERLAKAIEKVKLNQLPSSGSILSEDSRVFVKDGEQCWFVNLKEIRLFESIGNYTRVYFKENKPMIIKSLSYLEETLDPTLFFRINRQQIINIKYIDQVVAWFNGKLKLRLKSGEEVEVSRRQTNKLKDLFSF